MSLGAFWQRMFRIMSASNREKREMNVAAKMDHDGYSFLLDQAGKAHMVPSGDLQAHIIIGLQCPCNPYRNESANLIIHPAFDGRDLVLKAELGVPIV